MFWFDVFVFLLKIVCVSYSFIIKKICYLLFFVLGKKVYKNCYLYVFCNWYNSWVFIIDKC